MPSNHGLYNPQNKKKPARQRTPGLQTQSAATANVIYIMRWPAAQLDEVVKIGASTRGPLGRWDEHVAFHKKAGVTLRMRDLLAVVSGDRKDETNLGDILARFRWRGEKEMFHAVPEIVEWIRWLRDQWFVETGDEDDGKRIMALTGVEPVQYSDWRPGSLERRKKPARSGPLFSVENKFSQDGIHNLEKRQIEGDDIYSPEILMDVVHRFWPSGIDLDPASHPVANRTVKARRIYVRREDGASQPWDGHVWLNPSFSDWQRFVPKVERVLDREDQDDSVSELLCLVGTLTLTADYFHSILRRASSFCLIRGRLEFWGTGVKDPPSGHAILYFGPRREEFNDAFSSLGVIMDVRQPMTEERINGQDKERVGSDNCDS